jgi:hypothetical protein
MTDTVERKTLTREHLLDVYRTMRTIREFEERVHAEFATGEIPGFVHLYAGEEASAVGVCSNLDEQDTIARRGASSSRSSASYSPTRAWSPASWWTTCSPTSG